MEMKINQFYGILAIGNDIDVQNISDYHDWYFQKHLLERLHIPGFLCATRYESVGPGPTYLLNILHLRLKYLGVLPTWINNPPEWTRRNMIFLET